MNSALTCFNLVPAHGPHNVTLSLITKGMLCSSPFLVHLLYPSPLSELAARDEQDAKLTFCDKAGNIIGDYGEGAIDLMGADKARMIPSVHLLAVLETPDRFSSQVTQKRPRVRFLPVFS